MRVPGRSKNGAGGTSQGGMLDPESDKCWSRAVPRLLLQVVGISFSCCGPQMPPVLRLVATNCME